VLLAALLCTALGLALSFAPAKVLAQSFVLLSATALAAAVLIPEASEREPQALIATSISIVLTALCVLLPGGVRHWVAMVLSANAGLWCGVVAAVSNALSALLVLPLALVALPGCWIVSRGYAIVPKVLSGWLVAVAILAAALPLITTPGYQPDHME
jgi:hypothetical protein